MRNWHCRHAVRLVLAFMAVSLGSTPSIAGAESYPSRMIRIIVGGTSGTPPDTISRIVANDIGETEGWRVIVENKPGAIQTIGAAEVLKQPADGYSILCISLPAVAAPVLLPNVGFRLETDFMPVVKIATAYHVLPVGDLRARRRNCNSLL